MCVRERILTIRLMEKANANPALAEDFVTAVGYAGDERGGESE